MTHNALHAGLIESGDDTAPMAADGLRARGEAGGLIATRVARIELARIVFEDRGFRHRVRLDVDELARQMQLCGLAEPVILQALMQGKRFRIISGFRRVRAALDLGWTRIPAIVWDRVDARRALVASVVGNENRAPYNDLERAHIIRAWEQAGIDDLPITAVFGIGDRHRRNLLRLLELTAEAQAALVDPEHAFTGTHGLYLLRARGVDSDLDIGAWVRRIGDERLSVNALRACLTPRPRALRPHIIGLFGPESDLADGLVVLQRQTFKLAELEPSARDRLRRDLERLLEVLTASA